MLAKTMVRRVGPALLEVAVPVFLEAQVIRRLRRTSQKIRPLRFFFWRVWDYQVFKRMFTAWKIWIVVAEVFTAWKRTWSLELQLLAEVFTTWKRTWSLEVQLLAEVFTAWKRARSLGENSVVTQSAVPGDGAHLTNDAAASVGPHHADLEDCRRILLASASRIDVGGGKPYRLASLDEMD